MTFKFVFEDILLLEEKKKCHGYLKVSGQKFLLNFTNFMNGWGY